MVQIIRYISAAALVTVASAVPVYRRDGSAIGSEIPVSAPFGIPESDVPSSTDSSAAAATAAAPPPPPPVVFSSVDTLTMAPMATPPPALPPMASMDSMPPMDSMINSMDSMVNSMDSMVNSMDSMPPPPMASMDSMTPPMANSSIDSMGNSTFDSMGNSTFDSMGNSTMDSGSMMASDTMSADMPQMTYGSGSSSMSSGYNSCVQQCAASFPMTPSSTLSSGSAGGSAGGSVGGSATHTIIVAPSQGVLRYIPFSTNASVGDTVSFVWHAGPHTVTQSSALEVCNKTEAAGAFASGAQNTSFVFNQVINDTNPIWFYCGIPNHCQKGMFGGINIGQPDPTGSSTDFMPLSSVMANLTMMDPQMGALLNMTQTQTAGNLYASGWGMNTNVAGMSSDAMMQTAENVMYMQTLIAANPQAVQGGQFAVTSTSNLTIPPNLQIASNSTMSMASSAYPSASSAASSAMPSTSGSASSANANANGAISITSSRVVVGLVAIFATFFAL